MGSTNGNRALAKSYREKFGWEMPTLKLARIMYKENNLAFKDLDSARASLRYLEGKTGRHLIPRGIEKLPDRPKNPYNLPKSDEADWSPYVIKDAKKILVLSDIHVPYHNIKAITTMIDREGKEKPDVILLNGDLLDCHSLSKYVKNPKMRSFAEELEIAGQLINVLKKELCERIILKLGNHEERYQHFLWTKSKELIGVEDFEMRNLMIKRAGDIEVVSDKRIIKAGHLNIVHGHEFISSSGQVSSVAKSFYDKGKASVLGGHHHKTSEFTSVSMNGEMTTTFSSGCLCELHPQFMPINQWNLGYATVTLDGDYFEVDNYRIEKDKVL
jgi:predicted phosphodiesterase